MGRPTRRPRGGPAGAAAAPALAGGLLLGGLVAAIGLVRRPRPIHPSGIVLSGRIEPATSHVASGIEWIDGVAAGSVEARLSRGIGLPVPMPDIWGLAFRAPVSTGPPSAGPTASGDVLLAGVAGPGPLARFLPFPRLSPWGAPFSTVMPYRAPRGPVVVGARTVSGAPASASRTGQSIELARRPWVLELVWATPRGRWRPFATIQLSAADALPIDDERLRFDPVLSPPAGAGTYRWTRLLREPAYRAARRSGSTAGD